MARCALGCPVLVEEYLPGPEVTIGIAGNGAEAAMLGMMEIAPVSEDAAFVYSLEIKRDWRHCVRYHLPPRVSRVGAGRAGAACAPAAYGLLGCRDVARMDFRLDADGAPQFIECNPLPGLDPENSDLVILAARRPHLRRPRAGHPARRGGTDERADRLSSKEAR